MKRNVATIGVVVLTLSALMSPALAVSQADRDRCERLADKQLPALNAEEKEAFIANCLADASN
jgi:hypothetical protein